MITEGEIERLARLLCAEANGDASVNTFAICGALLEYYTPGGLVRAVPSKDMWNAPAPLWYYYRNTARAVLNAGYRCKTGVKVKG